MINPSASARLALPYLQAAQAQKHVTHNEALERLDILVQMTVESFSRNTPPELPGEGQIWIVGGSPTGEWSASAGNIAAWANGGWVFIDPQPGWRASSGGELRLFNGSEWVLPRPALESVPGIGINTSSDAVNRLAVAAQATLFSHEGAGHQIKINKSSSEDTASLVIQTGFSGRAELGTAGREDFSIKVSADGVTWRDGIVVDRHTGRISLPHGAEIAGAISGGAAENLPALISAPADTGAVTTAQGRAVIASVNSAVSAHTSVIAGGNGCEINTGNRNFIGGGQGCMISGSRTGVLGCSDVEMTSDITGAIGSSSSRVTTARAAVIAAQGVLNDTARSLAMGRGSGGPSAANRTIHLYGGSGDVEIAGSLTSSHTFSDFAEMFPNATGTEIPLGVIVTEEGGAVRPAGVGEDIAGVVTATAVVTAGDTPFAWQGRYLSDEWGRPVMETIPDPDHEGEGPAPLIEVRKENPAWNPDAPQTPRSARPDEWTRVGLLGQVFTRVAEGVAPGDRLSAVDGIGVTSPARTGLRCMTITRPYDAAKGYAVARCMVNVRV